ncbi:AT hook motif family protein [Zea mays]|uniref:AT hook motif family protein n=1 Tax=Zea mays TaxID=4577 RepID=A0A1D6N7P0_MAIZE|nr:AT hook motif family protein [Zea mays]
MEGADGKQESETTSIIKVPKEPAIIINGVPDFPFDCTTGSQSAVKNDAESHVDPRFGEWLEGRKVRKLFGDTYFVGKVAKYDIESNWYTVIYDDGDQEDLEWRELEKVLLPLDITVPLKTLVIDKCKLKGSVSDSKPKGAEDTPGSVALVPVQDDTQESSRKQNSTLIRNAMTARAERLKRENLRVQSRRSRTRLS